jgi:hypothetical protein
MFRFPKNDRKGGCMTITITISLDSLNEQLDLQTSITGSN